MRSSTSSWFVSAVLAAALLACTTRTEIVHRTNEAAAADDDPPAGAGRDPESDELDAADGGAPRSRDSGARLDGGQSAPSSDDAGPTQISGGKISLACPARGFHQPSPVVIASLPTTLLPRCSAATRTCAYAAPTMQAYDACLEADATPPASFDGESVDCKACDRTQGSYCLASACKSQFADYACCAQANGDAACAALLDAVTSCAGTTGKIRFEACIGALVSACFT